MSGRCPGWFLSRSRQGQKHPSLKKNQSIKEFEWEINLRRTVEPSRENLWECGRNNHSSRIVSIFCQRIEKLPISHPKLGAKRVYRCPTKILASAFVLTGQKHTWRAQYEGRGGMVRRLSASLRSIAICDIVKLGLWNGNQRQGRDEDSRTVSQKPTHTREVTSKIRLFLAYLLM